MTPEQREALLRAVTFDEIKKGRGSKSQIEAWRELEWRRCSASPLYFLSNYGWLKSKSGKIEPWTLYPSQEKMLADFMEGESIIAVKARQLGITTLTVHYFLWCVMFLEAAQCHLVSDSEDKAKEALSRVRITLSRIPQWMKHRARMQGRVDDSELRRKDKSDSKTSITFGFSEFTIRTSTPNSVAGLTGRIALDEFSRHREQDRVYENVIPAVEEGGQLIVIANGQGEDEFFRLYQAAKEGTNGFSHYFMSWRDVPSRDDEWYERTKQRYLRDNPDQDVYSFLAQYPSSENEAFYVTGNSRFRLDVINRFADDIRARKTSGVLLQRNGRIECGQFEKHPKGRWRLYEEPVPGASYVIGGDSSGGSQSGDYAALQVLRLDGEKCVQAAVFEAKAESTELAVETLNGANWFNAAFVVPEANNTGQLYIDRMKGEYANIYMRKSKVEHFAVQTSNNIGFWTDRATKPTLIGQLAEWLNLGRLVLNDSRTVEQLSHYEIKDDGIQTGAPKGMNDDLVMALALAVEGAVDETAFAKYETRILMPWEA